jgi:hypothetical protein
VHAGCDLANDDRGHNPVDDHAERRPPSRVGDEVGSVLPEVLESVAGRPATSSQGDSVIAAAATTIPTSSPLGLPRAANRETLALRVGSSRA